MANLSIAFPEKKIDERIIIAKDFYKNFVDNFIETIKVTSASKSFLTKHFIVDNPERKIHHNFRKENLRADIFLI